MISASRAMTKGTIFVFLFLMSLSLQLAEFSEFQSQMIRVNKFKSLIIDVQIVEIFILFKKGEMDEVVPLLRALHAMIIQYNRKTNIIVNKKTLHLMSRLAKSIVSNPE